MSVATKLCELCAHRTNCDSANYAACMEDSNACFFECDPDAACVEPRPIKPRAVGSPIQEYAARLSQELFDTKHELEKVKAQNETLLGSLERQTGGKHFAGDVMQRIEQSVLKDIETLHWIDWSKMPKLKIDAKTIEDAYALITPEKITRRMAELLETKLAGKLFDTLQTELSNDIKHALGTNHKLRNDVREACVKVINNYIYLSKHRDK